MNHGGYRQGSGRKNGIGISEETKAQILKDYRNNVPVATIAQRHGVSESYPTILARREGLTMRQSQGQREIKQSRRGPRPMVNLAHEVEGNVITMAGIGLRAEIRRLDRKGLGITAIASLLRCRYREIQAALERMEA